MKINRTLVTMSATGFLLVMLAGVTGHQETGNGVVDTFNGSLDRVVLAKYDSPRAGVVVAVNDFEVVSVEEDDETSVTAEVNKLEIQTVGVAPTDVDVPSDEERALEEVGKHYVDGVDNVPNGEEGCKSYCFSYMAYTAVTSRTSPQYKLLNGEDAHTGATTGIRMIGDRFCIAVGTYYADHVGQKLDVVMKNGSVIKCIVGDFKSNQNTDPTHRYHTGGWWKGVYYEGDGSVVEFIVDTSVFRGTSQYPDEVDGEIKRIVRVDD